MYRLFSVEHSIFSAKVRSYLRFKQDQKDLGTGPQDPQLVADAIAHAASDPSAPFRIPVGEDAELLFGAQKATGSFEEFETAIRARLNWYT